ncbi:12483_t:CDS:10 [Entrophospora sp. SA101]|nr:12483_t:CDS:10 [Entrophospora sp. SA101]
MAARHRARFSSIQILRIAEIKTSQVKRPYIKQLLEKNLRFPLPHRVMRSERKTKFLAKRENYELRADLNSEYRDRRKDAIKKVIANMTVGKDVSGLFPEVLKNMQTEDLEQKKLVYLYLMNYAKTQPELVILAVNTFVKDTDDSNPLIRALAIRTMGCIRVEKIIDYLCEPLRKCLKDDDPYVRKTASICVAKLYDLNPELAIENGFVSLLQDMVSDSNPMVVANAITALAEINEASTTKDLFIINTSTLTKLLAALNVCTEWGRIAILTALADFKPADSKEAEHIVERVIPQFQHANASVVLSAIKMAPPLVTLLSSAPEVQYVALRNINLILQKQPDILQNEIRVFFCKYNDPPYIKLEKLEIMIKLASEKNVDQLLSELKEYASEVDVDIVRKSVRVIGQCAIKIDETSERCVNVLLDLINTRVNYVVQEAIVVIKDIFRKYPHKYEGIIPTLCENLDALDEPEAKASLIWIIGEYAEKIENAHDLILTFLDTFRDESSQVQLQLVTATIKLFLKKPQTTPDTVQKMLQLATKQCDNPDIRDRAYIYWRLLSTDPQAGKAVVLSDKPTISVQSNSMSGPLLEELINNISTLASVYHKPPETFIGKGRFGADAVQKKAIEEQEEASNESSIRMQVKTNVENLLDLDYDDSLFGDDTSSTSQSTTSNPNNNRIEALTFDYIVPFPLSLVISRKSLTKYQLLFRHLFYLKHAEQLLYNTWKEHTKSYYWKHGSGHPSIEGWKGQLYALRQKMIVFVQQFIYYVTSEASTVDQVLKYHSDFLDTCLKECMLTNAKLLRVEKFTKSLVSLETQVESMTTIIQMDYQDRTLRKFEEHFVYHIKLLIEALNFYSATETASFLYPKYKKGYFSFKNTNSQDYKDAEENLQANKWVVAQLADINELDKLNFRKRMRHDLDHE